MALINCPECNNQVSDKADKCIHCGYPLKSNRIIETILGKEYDVSFLLDKSVSQAIQIKQIKELTGCDLFTAKAVVLKYHPTIQESQEQNIPKCPTCGSTNIKKISAGSRWLSTGLFGISSSKMGKSMECRHCGYKW